MTSYGPDLEAMAAVRAEPARLAGAEREAAPGRTLRVARKDAAGARDPVSVAGATVAGQIGVRLGATHRDHDVVGAGLRERPDVGHAVDSEVGIADIIGRPRVASAGALRGGVPVLGAVCCSTGRALRRGTCSVRVGGSPRFGGSPFAVVPPPRGAPRARGPAGRLRRERGRVRRAQDGPGGDRVRLRGGGATRRPADRPAEPAGCPGAAARGSRPPEAGRASGRGGRRDLQRFGPEGDPGARRASRGPPARGGRRPRGMGHDAAPIARPPVRRAGGRPAEQRVAGDGANAEAPARRPRSCGRRVRMVEADGDGVPADADGATVLVVGGKGRSPGTPVGRSRATCRWRSCDPAPPTTSSGPLAWAGSRRSGRRAGRPGIAHRPGPARGTWRSRAVVETPSAGAIAAVRRTCEFAGRAGGFGPRGRIDGGRCTIAAAPRPSHPLGRRAARPRGDLPSRQVTRPRREPRRRAQRPRHRARARRGPFGRAVRRPRRGGGWRPAPRPPGGRSDRVPPPANRRRGIGLPCRMRTLRIVGPSGTRLADCAARHAHRRETARSRRRTPGRRARAGTVTKAPFEAALALSRDPTRFPGVAARRRARTPSRRPWRRSRRRARPDRGRRGSSKTGASSPAGGAGVPADGPLRARRGAGLDGKARARREAMSPSLPGTGRTDDLAARMTVD